MSVVNVKVNYIRPKYNNLKEWMKDENNVYIGRRGIVFIEERRFPEKDSIWANPFKIGRDGSRDEVLNKYKIYITNKLKDKNMLNELLKLKNKNLGCWCKPDQCHSDILLNIINNIE